jgi:hypothetical protein
MPKKVFDTPLFQSSSFDGPFYKVVRLKTGESILCKMHKDIRTIATEMYLNMVNPVLASLTKELKQQNTGQVAAEYFTLRPWIGLSSSQELTIGTEIVLTVGDMKPSFVKQYKQYLIDCARAEQIRHAAEEESSRTEAIINLLASISSDGETVRFINHEDI